MEDEVKKWAGADRKGKGKAKAEVRGLVDELPGEVLVQVCSSCWRGSGRRKGYV